MGEANRQRVEKVFSHGTVEEDIDGEAERTPKGVNSVCKRSSHIQGFTQ
jgi:hypothetical protein